MNVTSIPVHLGSIDESALQAKQYRDSILPDMPTFLAVGKMME